MYSTDSAQGEVSVWVRSVGGGEKSNVVPAPGSGAPQTVAEALYARKSGEKATAGQDYDIINTRLFFNVSFFIRNNNSVKTNICCGLMIMYQFNTYKIEFVNI